VSVSFRCGLGARERSRKGSTPHRPIHTGSGQSVDGTSGRWQGAPFAGSHPVCAEISARRPPQRGSGDVPRKGCFDGVA